MQQSQKLAGQSGTRCGKDRALSNAKAVCRMIKERGLEGKDVCRSRTAGTALSKESAPRMGISSYCAGGEGATKNLSQTPGKTPTAHSMPDAPLGRLDGFLRFPVERDGRLQHFSPEAARISQHRAVKAIGWDVRGVFAGMFGRRAGGLRGWKGSGRFNEWPGIGLGGWKSCGIYFAPPHWERLRFAGWGNMTGPGRQSRHFPPMQGGTPWTQF